ncbi:protein FAR1-RELATED SEQUENCE 5-like [Prosopis cineraria]|uniref:protein FAR1-RELATED SEQUENCE 5-like n=1 Tax=Prosopis cineraria TaxID=364024 RepID=UPI00240EB419|nr:protein FAR1-RELATED SEQUENCE 5-like [Prosopis cineraria]
MDTSMTPIVGLEFDDLEEAWQYWIDYGGRIGFSVRKQNSNKSKKDDSIIYCKYVCSKEGVKKADKRDFKTKKPRKETRTGCEVKMIIKKVNERFRVSELFLDHNHPLEPPETIHLLASQRRLPKAQGYALEFAEDTGIKQKASFNLMSKYARGRANLGYTKEEVKSYLRSRRQRDMIYGEAGFLLRYFQQQLTENPSFFHAYQMDSEEQITNVFWADARMLIDYDCFGDVISFDTTYSTNRDNRPLAIFSGFNHYREVVIFGAALLYDETIESFKWLFETFLQAHKQKMPFTMFTDQDAAMARALEEIMPNVKHGLCTFHINRNGVKHLGNLMKDGSRFLGEFNWCMYHCKEETRFEESWKELLSKYNVEENPWLMSIYKLKEKWAACYMKYSKTLGMRSTQLSESINSFIKSCTNPELNISQFFNVFEQVVVDKRYNELQSDFNSRQKLPRLILKSSSMLQQLSQVYTPPIFDLFQHEYDLRDATCIKERKERKIAADDDALVIDYVITMVDKKGEWRLTFEPSREDKEAVITCNCKKFEQWGILCCHALRILYDQDVKLLPKQYVLKRWTKEARCGVVHDSKGKEIEVDPKLECSNRYRQLCPMLIKLASDASECSEAFSMVHQAVLELSKKVSQLLINHSSDSVNNEGGVDDDVGKNDGSGIGFKKRERKKISPSWDTQNILEVGRSSSSVQYGSLVSNMPVQVQNDPPVSNMPVQVQCGPPVSNMPVQVQCGPPVSNMPVQVQCGPPVSNMPVQVQCGPIVSNIPVQVQTGPLVPSMSVQVQNGPLVPSMPVQMLYGPPVSSMLVQGQYGPTVSRMPVQGQYGPTVSRMPVQGQYSPPVLGMLVQGQYGLPVPNTPITTQHDPLQDSLNNNVKSLEAIEFSQVFEKDSNLNVNTNPQL